MPYFDRDRGEIVVRIAYDGLATAGKTTNVRMLHEALRDRSPDGVVVPAESATGRTLYFDWLELALGHLDVWPLRAQIVSVPGQFALVQRRFDILRDVDGAVLVCDSSERGVEQAVIAITMLADIFARTDVRTRPVVLQANKQDLPGALDPQEILRRMPVVPAAVVPAVAVSGDGVKLTLYRMLDLVRNAARERLARDGVDGLPTGSGSAEDLHRALVLAEETLPSDDLSSVLDHALALVK